MSKKNKKPNTTAEYKAVSFHCKLNHAAKAADRHRNNGEKTEVHIQWTPEGFIISVK